MKFSNSLLLIFVFMSWKAHGQILSLGVKWEEKLMGEASANLPVFWKNDSKFDLMLGVNYTTPNKEFPSGLQPQVTGMYRIVSGEYKDYFLSFNLTSGYLFDFSSEFDHQFRFSPHLYFEYLGFLNLKVGYDYVMPLEKGYPFISIGLGGLYMFKDFRIM
jgi:hypothetical protein